MGTLGALPEGGRTGAVMQERTKSVAAVAGGVRGMRTPWCMSSHCPLGVRRWLRVVTIHKMPRTAWRGREGGARRSRPARPRSVSVETRRSDDLYPGSSVQPGR